MFLIPEFYVEDKNLPKVLTALAGLALNMKAPVPVTNAVVQNGKVRQANHEATTIKDQFLDAVGKMPQGTIFTSSNIKQMIGGFGGSTSAYNHYVKAMKDAKLAKPRSRGHFIRT